MSSFAGQRSGPWTGDLPRATTSGPAAGAGDDVRDDARGALGGDAGSTNASAISFGFAATAVLVSLFLLMAIFEHLVKPGLSSSSSSGGSRHDDGGGGGEGPPPARRLPHGRDASPGKLGHWPKVEPAANLTVLMPGQRYPTFLAQPAPLLQPCTREGVRWPPHERRHCFPDLPP